MALSPLVDQHLGRNASACSTTSTTSTTSSSSSSSTYKRTRAGVPALPASVAWLEHTSFEMTASMSKKFANCSSAYVLHVHHRDAEHKQQLAWTVSRPFDDYADFQQRLLKTLALGHACSAECRWLHSFVKNYFPKKARFFFNCGVRTMNVRREKLARCLNVLQSSLLNRGNHGCGILVQRVAAEFEAFVHGEKRFTKKASCAKLLAAKKKAAAAAVVSDSDDDEDELVRRCSISSSVSSTSTDDAEGQQHHLGELVNTCDLCDSSLDECVAADLTADGTVCHTTTLSCGHQFHDSCVLPELAALNYCCPSCNAPQLQSQRH